MCVHVHASVEFETDEFFTLFSLPHRCKDVVEYYRDIFAKRKLTPNVLYVRIWIVSRNGCQRRTCAQSHQHEWKNFFHHPLYFPLSLLVYNIFVWWTKRKWKHQKKKKRVKERKIIFQTFRRVTFTFSLLEMRRKSVLVAWKSVSDSQKSLISANSIDLWKSEWKVGCEKSRKVKSERIWVSRLTKVY